MIPYTTERRADTGVTNVTLGVWLLIASEVMLFGALFSSYALLRVASTEWPSGRALLSLPIGSTTTILLIVALQCVRRAQAASPDRTGRWLTWSTVLALLFLGFIGAEYARAIAAGRLPSVNTFLAMYFTLTGVHAVHVVGGIAANVWALGGLRRVDAALSAGRVRALAAYWVFVTLTWGLIFVLLYLS